LSTSQHGKSMDTHPHHRRPWLHRRLAASGRKVVSYNRDHSESDDPGVVVVQGELFDIPRLMHVVCGHGVDAIVHTAAVSHPTLSLDFPVGTFAANVDGTLGVLEAARLTDGRRVVNFSSETVYGRADGTIDERTPVAPSTPYAVTKVANFTQLVSTGFLDRERNAEHLENTADGSSC
jgi:nucleoside-diphosphate-sugar epimerase